MDPLVAMQRQLLLEPVSRQTLLQLAEWYRDRGALHQSTRCLQLLLRHVPGDPEALFWISHQGGVLRQAEATAQLEHLQRSLDDGDLDPSLSPDALSFLYFALAKLREEQQRWQEAFQLYSLANQQRKRALGLLNTDAVHYVEQAQLMVHLDARVALGLAGDPCLETSADDGDPGDDLVFIVGLPRCGSTLVETMLGLVEQVEPLGELRALPEAVRETGLLELLRRDPLDPAGIEAGLQRFRAAYRSVVPPSSGHTVDKTLTNYFYVGLIAWAWPKARIVHVLREPLDQILSAWKARFREGHHYSLELADLVRVQQAYRRLMRIWHERYGERIHLCRYEQLVADPVQHTKALAQFCGLAWSEHMLHPQLSRRVVRTASFQQVREPVHRSSVESWRRYAQELEPYRLQLEQAGLLAEGV